MEQEAPGVCLRELKAELDSVSDRLRFLAVESNNINRIRDSIASTVKKRDQNDIELAKFEPGALPVIERRQQLIKQRGNLDLVLGAKGSLTTLKNTVDVLSGMFPETTNMTVTQLLEFLESKKFDLKGVQDKLKAEISRLGEVETKYNNMVKRREHLTTVIAEKEAQVDELVKNYVVSQRTLVDVKRVLSLYERGRAANNMAANNMAANNMAANNMAANNVAT